MNARLRPAEIAKIIRDMFCSAYLGMVLELANVMEELVGWLERCPCHGYLQYKFRGKRHIPISLLRRWIGGRANARIGLECWMRGRREPDLAAGILMDLFEMAWQDSVAALVIAHRLHLIGDQWESLFRDFICGKAHCSYILTMKLGVWHA